MAPTPSDPGDGDEHTGAGRSSDPGDGEERTGAGRRVDRTPGTEPRPDTDVAALARALAAVGRAARDAVRSAAPRTDHRVVRTEGGDDVFGVDARADAAVLEALAQIGDRWPGRLIMEGFDEPIPVGDPAGPWTYLVDPVDGTRGYLAGKRSAWVLLGAGRNATTLEDLEVGAAVEVPTARAALGLVAWAARGRGVTAEDDDLVSGHETHSAVPIALTPRADADLERSFVTVVRLLPGGHGPIGAWADRLLDGLEVYDDLYPCTGGHLMDVARGAAAAVLDPRPLLHPGSLASHPYDLAGLVVYREAGVVVEALPPGPFTGDLTPSTDVAFAGYANEAVAARLRPTDLR